MSVSLYFGLPGAGKTTLMCYKAIQGTQGPKGEGYSLTEADIAEISGVVAERISKYSLKVDSGGYIAVEYKG